MGKKRERDLRADRRPVAPGAQAASLHLAGRPAATTADAGWWTGSPTFLVEGQPVARAGDLRAEGGDLAPFAPHADADAGERRLELRVEGPQGEPLEGAFARCHVTGHAPRERVVRAGRAVFAALPAKEVEVEVEHPLLVQGGPVRVRCRRGRTQAVVRLERHHLGPLCEARGLRLVSDGDHEAHWHHLAPDWGLIAAPGPAPPPSLDHHQPGYDFAPLDAQLRARGRWPCVVGPLVGAGPLPWWCAPYVEARTAVLRRRQDLRDPALAPATQAWGEALANVVQTCVGRYAPPEASRGFLVAPSPAHGGQGHVAWPRVSPVSHSWGRPPRVLGWHLAATDLDGVDGAALLPTLLDAVHRMTPDRLLVVDLPSAVDFGARWQRLRALRRGLGKAARRQLVVRWAIDVAQLSPGDADEAAAALPKRAALWLDLRASDPASPPREVRRRLAPLLATRRVLALAAPRPGVLLAPPSEIALQGALARAKPQRAATMLPAEEAAAPWLA